MLITFNIYGNTYMFLIFILGKVNLLFLNDLYKNSMHKDTNPSFSCVL